ncbi:hypothetical protein E4U17_004798 [Claviceps sp. LM77 group G4]|nr:hypothetical protein E4U17_004798 [Claviceps sp. LM77 group G4]KAG6070246.1 hypothetical protein E4U33_004300 [Claviceps sp. LM78 group G4]KAG6072258.1 hypothetical protein E4U16_005514 [Claviceps sp. LM84 group G4]
MSYILNRGDFHPTVKFTSREIRPSSPRRQQLFTRIPPRDTTPKKKKEATDEGKTTRSIATSEEPFPCTNHIHAGHRFDEPRNEPIAYQPKRAPKK